MSLCETCHAGCCRSFSVPLSGADILRIEQQLSVDFWDFVCRWADPQGNIARNYAPHFHFSDEPETPFVICLMHEPGSFLPGTTKCRLLMEGQPDDAHPLGVAKCGIYQSRPAACRCFPVKLNGGGDLAIIHDVPARGRDGGNGAYDLCPRAWEPADMDPLQTMQDLVVAKYEMAFFHQLADIWNRQRRQWSLFPDFLRTVYAGRVQHESDVEDFLREPYTIKMTTLSSGIRAKAA